MWLSVSQIVQDVFDKYTTAKKFCSHTTNEKKNQKIFCCKHKKITIGYSAFDAVI